MKSTALGLKIEKLRKKQALSQEALAEEAGLNLRTIQRIEKNETVPRGDSLKRIAEALNVTPDEIIDYSLTEDWNYLKIMNLSSLCYLFFPLLGLVLPLLFWIFKRDKIQGVDTVGKHLLNFQITWIIVYYIGRIITSESFARSFNSWDPLNFLDFRESLYLNSFFVIAPIYIINFFYIILNVILISRKKPVYYKPVIQFLR